MASEVSRSSFLFVAPSDPVGPGDAYGGASPARVFSRTSWEWLLERYLRRANVLRAVGSSDPARFLSSRAGAYRLAALLPSGFANADGAVRESPLSLPPAAALPGPDGVAASETVAYRASDLALLVPALSWRTVGGHCFRDPSSPFSGWSSDGSLLEAADVSWEPGGSPEGSLSVSVSPMDGMDRLPVFRMLADMRLDDPPATLSVPAWDPSAGAFRERAVRLPRVPFPRVPELGAETAWGSVGEFVARGGAAVLRLDGLSPVSRSLGLPYFPVPAGVAGEVSSLVLSSDPAFPSGAVGALQALPAAARGGVGLCDSLGTPGSLLHPSPSWDGAPTFWEARGFPVASPAPASVPELAQLRALGTVRPSVPPALSGPARTAPFSGLPGAGASGREVAELWFGTERPGASLADPGSAPWPSAPRFPVAAACEPAEISRMLGLLASTVLPVPAGTKVSARVSRRTRRTVSWTVPGGAGERTETTDLEEEGAFVGDVAGLLGASSPCGPAWPWAPCSGSGGGSSWRSETDAGAEAEDVVLLLPSAASRVPPCGGTVETSEPGSEPVSRVLGWPGDEGPAPEGPLFLGPSVLAWAASAELLLALDVVASARGGYVLEEDGDGGGRESGSRTSRRRISVASLGRLDLATGRISGSLDLAAVLAAAVPSGASLADVPSGFAPGVRSGSREEVPVRHVPEILSARLYLSADWRFDATEPPRPSPSPSA